MFTLFPSFSETEAKQIKYKRHFFSFAPIAILKKNVAEGIDNESQE